MRDRRSPIVLLRELGLPRAERAAARAERRAEVAMRLQRDNVHSPERRAAALDAECRKYGNFPSKRATPGPHVR